MLIAYRKNTKSLWPTVALLAICSPSHGFCPLRPAEEATGVTPREAESPEVPRPALVPCGSPVLAARPLPWSPSLEPAPWRRVAAARDRADDPFQGLVGCDTEEGPLWILLAQDRGGPRFGRRKRAWCSTLTSTSGREQHVPGQHPFWCKFPLPVFLQWGNSIFHNGQVGKQEAKSMQPWL